MNTLRIVMLLAAMLAAAAVEAVDTELRPGMDKEREATVAKWKKTLAGDDQAAIEKTLAEADAKSGIAFGMSDWPQVVAEAAFKMQPPLQDLLLNHLRRHRSLINKTTADGIQRLFNRDVLDPQGAQVKAWVKAGDQGPAAAEALLKSADEAKRPDEVVGLLDAIARCGNARFLPVAAGYLGHGNEQVAQAALSVFKSQAKDLEPDVRSPMRCQVWWLQTGKGLFEGK